MSTVDRRCTMTLIEASARIWDERWQFNKDGKRSLQNFKNTFKYLGGDDRELHTITAEDLMSLRLMLRKLKGPSTVNRLLASVKTVLKQAQRIWGAVSVVPYIQMEKETARRDRILSYDEEDKILGWLKKDWENCPTNRRLYDSIYNKRSYYNFLILLMDTGARPSELLRLKPHDYSKHTRRLYIGPGKTDDYRYVWLTDRAVNAFEDQVRFRSGMNLFGFKIEVISRYFNYIKKDLLINDSSLTPYCYRHTCATRMVESGVNISVIKKQRKR